MPSSALNVKFRGNLSDCISKHGYQKLAWPVHRWWVGQRVSTETPQSQSRRAVPCLPIALTPHPLRVLPGRSPSLQLPHRKMVPCDPGQTLAQQRVLLRMDTARVPWPVRATQGWCSTHQSVQPPFQTPPWQGATRLGPWERGRGTEVAVWGKKASEPTPERHVQALSPGENPVERRIAPHPSPSPPWHPRPGPAGTGGDRRGQAVLTLLGWSMGRGSSSSGTKITSSSFLARRRPWSRPIVDLCARAGRQGPPATAQSGKDFSKPSRLPRVLSCLGGRKGGQLQLPFAQKAGLLASLFRWDW